MTKTRIRKPRKMTEKKVKAATEKFYQLWPDKRPKNEDYRAITNEDIAEADFRADLLADMEAELENRLEEDKFGDEPSLLFYQDHPDMDDFGARPISDTNRTQSFHKIATSDEYERWNEYRNEETRWFGLWLASKTEQEEEYTLYKHNHFKNLREQLEESVLLV